MITPPCGWGSLGDTPLGAGGGGVRSLFLGRCSLREGITPIPSVVCINKLLIKHDKCGNHKIIADLWQFMNDSVPLHASADM